jgi:hypothetical protein
MSWAGSSRQVSPGRSLLARCALLAVLVSLVPGAPIVARLSPLSIAAGKLTAGDQQDIYVSARVVDVAIGARVAPSLAVAAGFIFGERFPFAGEELLTVNLVPSVDAYVLWASSLRRNPRKAVVVGHIGGLPAGDTRFVNVVVSVCWTLWAICPELEASWRSVWAIGPENQGLGSGGVTRSNQFGLLIRVALGGWYEF